MLSIAIAIVGWRSSRLIPPVEPTAASVWQPVQPTVVKIWRPAATSPAPVGVAVPDVLEPPPDVPPVEVFGGGFVGVGVVPAFAVLTTSTPLGVLPSASR